MDVAGIVVLLIVKITLLEIAVLIVRQNVAARVIQLAKQGVEDNATGHVEVRVISNVKALA